MAEESQLFAVSGEEPIIIGQAQSVSQILPITKIHKHEQAQVTKNGMLLFRKEQFLPVFVFCLVFFPKVIKHAHGWYFQIFCFPTFRSIISRFLEHLFRIALNESTTYADIHNGSEGAKGNADSRKTQFVLFHLLYPLVDK